MKIDMQFFGAPDFSKQRTPALNKTIRSLEKHIEEHLQKISIPELLYPQWNEFDVRMQEGLKKHWAKEIRNFQEQLKAAKDELEKRGDLHDQ